MTDGLTIDLDDLYKSAMRIRAVELVIAEKYPEQEMRCPVHLSVGQEIVPAAFGMLFDASRDACFSAHRSHAHYLGLGGDLTAMFGELLGKSFGCAGGKGGSMHLIDLRAGLKGAVPIVGSSIPMAVGYAHANKILGRDGVTLVFLGDGATEEGVFCESLDYAALHELRIVFVVEANRYSVYTPLSRRQFAGRDALEISKAHGVEATDADGYNVSAVVGLVRQTMDRMRAEARPLTVRFDTYRWLEHCGPSDDDSLGYRPQGELNNWVARCPLRQLASDLNGPGYEETLGAMMDEVIAEYDRCRRAGDGYSDGDLRSNLCGGEPP